MKNRKYHRRRDRASEEQVAEVLDLASDAGYGPRINSSERSYLGLPGRYAGTDLSDYVATLTPRGATDLAKRLRSTSERQAERAQAREEAQAGPLQRLLDALRSLGVDPEAKVEPGARVTDLMTAAKLSTVSSLRNSTAAEFFSDDSPDYLEALAEKMEAMLADPESQPPDHGEQLARVRVAYEAQGRGWEATMTAADAKAIDVDSMWCECRAAEHYFGGCGSAQLAAIADHLEARS